MLAEELVLLRSFSNKPVQLGPTGSNSIMSNYMAKSENGKFGLKYLKGTECLNRAIIPTTLLILEAI